MKNTDRNLNEFNEDFQDKLKYQNQHMQLSLKIIYKTKLKLKLLAISTPRYTPCSIHSCT